MGELFHPASYTQLLLREVLGVDLAASQADALTAGVFALVAIVSITLNLRIAGDHCREG